DCRILAWACLMEGRYEDALEWGRKGVAATPDLYLAWVELANELARLDRLDEAKEALQRAKTFVPTFTLDLYEKGCRLAWRGNEDIVAALVEGLRKLDTD
ncbi:MAG: hypothetical protein P8Y95_10705, partial [Gammaproteobacteria bacterium]